MSEEDDKYLYFVVQSSGFSHFAINGKIKAKEAFNETEPSPEIGSLEQKNESISTSNEQTPKQKENTTPGFEIIYAITGLLTLFLCRKRR